MSANPNKPLHIGQARNICIGDSIKKVFNYLGYQTHASNYGDDS
jgi:arginyl-tRNA synthetase